MFKIDFFGFRLLNIYLRANLYYFHSFFQLWVWSALPFLPRVKIGCLLSFFSNVCIHSFIFHCWWCFCRIPYMLVCSIYSLICLQVLSKFLFLNYFLACWLFKSVFNLHILVDFPTFPSTIDFSFHYIVTGKSSFVWFECI